MVLVFYNELPPGNKFVTFFSQKRNTSITVDTTQENAMVLYALIPSECNGKKERGGRGGSKGGRGKEEGVVRGRERERERVREGLQVEW